VSRFRGWRSHFLASSETIVAGLGVVDGVAMSNRGSSQKADNKLGVEHSVGLRRDWRLEKRSVMNALRFDIVPKNERRPACYEEKNVEL